MKAIVLGVIVIVIAVLAILPSGLNWKQDVLSFLRGSLPIAAVFIGVILFFTGISDIKDRVLAKKEKAQNKD
jgi:uncharacterized membrane protein (DUF441 family)